MRSEDAWVLYQKARSQRAKAEIAVIEKRAAAAAAEEGFEAACKAEMEASDAWRRIVGAESKSGDAT